MDIKQVEMVLQVLKDSFGNSKAYDSDTVAQTWWMMGLDGLPFDGVMGAVKKQLSNGGFKYPPSLNDVADAYRAEAWIRGGDKKPLSFESLSERSVFKMAIIRMVKLRHPGYKKTHQFSSSEDMEKSLHILSQQRKKLEQEVFEKYFPIVQRYSEAGNTPIRTIELAFGPEFVHPKFRTTQQSLPGGSSVQGLVEGITKSLSGGAR